MQKSSACTENKVPPQSLVATAVVSFNAFNLSQLEKKSFKIVSLLKNECVPLAHPTRYRCCHLGREENSCISLGLKQHKQNSSGWREKKGSLCEGKRKKIKHLDSTNAAALSYTRLSVCQVTKKSSDLGGEKGKWGCVSMCRNVRQGKAERIFLNIILFSFFFFFSLSVFKMVSL